jgi:transcriptional regulator with PAS, ATPase and Fis domain
MPVPLIGVSKDILKIKELIARVAHTGLNVVITGESGVGKEVVAHQLYKQSPRAGKPFIKINCAALPETLLESELFGHDRGAFTGAVKKKRGKFELSHQGTLLLDEIGDMPFALQAKLLRALQSGEIIPLGSEKEIIVDTWVIATTNQELERHIAQQRFREDLYYRLNTISIYVPPLRERPEDIPVLIDYYVKRYASKYLSDVSLDRATIKELTAHSWPGNVRELQNVLKRILVLGDSEKVIAQLKNPGHPQEDLDLDTERIFSSSFIHKILDFEKRYLKNTHSLPLKKVKKKALNIVEKEVICAVIEKTGGNKSKAARILGISYKTLLYKIKELKITPPYHNT